ncbi:MULTISPECIES: oxygenase MpaB family protein [unclassified Nocardioides]|uniref:oxygenase MpaB family protein n=1 Tax=unclassified Nocardioides TaxID=2615069 RepID=UPI000AFFBEF6|nr:MULTISPECIES: oxygenase MpaB family protein [unclassified Nocardioides]
MPRKAPTTLAGTVTSLGNTSGVANIIMQLSLPAVGEGVSESRVTSGSPRRHPVKRGRTTGQYLALAVMGDDDDRTAMREAVAEVHRHVHSTPDSPVRYSGNAADLQLWVAACLFRFYLDQYTLLHGPLERDQLDVLTRAAQPLATGVNVRAADWPADWAAFEAYWAGMVPRLSISEEVRRDFESLADLSFLAEAWGLPGRLLSRVAGRTYHFLTRGNLPPEFRALMGWTWSTQDQRWFDRALRGLRLLDRLGNRVAIRMVYRLYVLDFRVRRRLGLPVLGRLKVSDVMVRDGGDQRWLARRTTRAR